MNEMVVAAIGMALLAFAGTLGDLAATLPTAASDQVVATH